MQHVPGDRVERGEGLVHQQTRPGPGPGPARRAGACRRRARGSACRRRRRAGPARSSPLASARCVSARPTPRSRSASSMLSPAVSHGNRRRLLEHQGRGRSARGAGAPGPRWCRRVGGPGRRSGSAGWTCRSRRRRAGTRTRPRRTPGRRRPARGSAVPAQPLDQAGYADRGHRRAVRGGGGRGVGHGHTGRGRGGCGGDRRISGRGHRIPSIGAPGVLRHGRRGARRRGAAAPRGGVRRRRARRGDGAPALRKCDRPGLLGRRRRPRRGWPTSAPVRKGSGGAPPHRVPGGSAPGAGRSGRRCRCAAAAPATAGRGRPRRRGSGIPRP